MDTIWPLNSLLFFKIREFVLFVANFKICQTQQFHFPAICYCFFVLNEKFVFFLPKQANEEDYANQMYESDPVYDDFVEESDDIYKNEKEVNYLIIN